MDEDVAPLHEGTTATIRSTSLSGIANRYVSITPGPNNGREIDDGGQIGADETNAPVDIDVLFNTLDDKTRDGPAQRDPRLGDLVRGPRRRRRARAPSTSPRSSPAPRG